MFSHSPHPHLRLPGDGFMVVLAIAVKSGSFFRKRRRRYRGGEARWVSGIFSFSSYCCCSELRTRTGCTSHLLGLVDQGLEGGGGGVWGLRCIMGVKYELAYVAPNAALLMYFAGPKSMFDLRRFVVWCLCCSNLTSSLTLLEKSVI